MNSMLDGALIEYVATLLSETRRKSGKDAILMAWDVEDRTRLWLEAWRLSQSGWHIAVLAEPIESPRPELFPGKRFLSGRVLRQPADKMNFYNTGTNKVIKSFFTARNQHVSQ